MISKFELSLLYSLLVYQYVKDRCASLKALNDNGYSINDKVYHLSFIICHLATLSRKSGE